MDPAEYVAKLGLRLTPEGYLVEDSGLARTGIMPASLSASRFR